MSQSLLRDLLTAGIDANLTKNEWGCYAVMLIQTIGYGKPADALTTKRIAKQSHIRKDRAELAIASLLGKGLMDATEHKTFDWKYAIPAHHFADDAPTRFFAPTVPKNGNFSRVSEEVSENRTHTEIQPLQSSTITETNNDQPSQPVCDVSLNPVTEIKKPAAVDESTYVALLPALRTLPNSQALDVLALLAIAISNGSIKASPAQLGGGLIKAARAGTLDTTPLQAQQQAEEADVLKQQREAAREAREAAIERAALIQLAQRAGISATQLGVRS